MGLPFLLVLILPGSVWPRWIIVNIHFLCIHRHNSLNGTISVCADTCILHKALKTRTVTQTKSIASGITKWPYHRSSVPIRVVSYIVRSHMRVTICRRVQQGVKVVRLYLA